MNRRGSYRSRGPNLTPLFDLLILLVFAQAFMIQGKLEDESNAREEGLTYISGLEEKLTKAGVRVAELTAEKEQLQAKVNESKFLEEQVQRQEASVKELGALFKEMFDLPDDFVETAMSGASPVEIDQVKRTLASLRDANAEDVVRELRKINEFNKRCDFWEATTGTDNTLSLKVEDTVVLAKFVPSSIEEAKRRLSQAVDRHTGGVVKPNVIVLHYWGNAYDEVLTITQDALRTLATQFGVGSNARMYYVEMGAIES
ncbi:MAG: hypothetical protein AMXMBFR82_29540 [Candidatus Hydrogenedentota bacterium]